MEPIANWTYRNTQLVQPNAGPDFNGFRRIANDNVNLGATGGVAENENKEEGALTGKKMMVKAPKKQGKNVVVETAVTNGKDTHQIAYTIYPNGTVDMKVTTNNSSEETRRIGITMQFAPGFENVKYYAKGPWSNYIDRQRGSLLRFVQDHRGWHVRRAECSSDHGRPPGPAPVDTRQQRHEVADYHRGHGSLLVVSLR